MGTDPELDGFLARAPRPCILQQHPNAARLPKPCLAHHAAPLRVVPPMACIHALTWHWHAAQRAYVKELELLKAELEQILSAVRGPCKPRKLVLSTACMI